VGFALSGAFGLLSGGLVLSMASQEPSPGRLPAGKDGDSLIDMTSGLVTIHDAAGKVVSVHGRDVAGIKGELRALAGIALVDEIHVSDRIDYLQAVDRMRRGDDSASVDVRLERAEPGGARGQFVFARMEMTARHDDDGAFRGFMAEIADIGAEAGLRAENHALQAEIAAAHETKTRFLAAVSHELRTPLNAILGFSDILIGGYFGPLSDPRQSEYVHLINQSGQHLLAVVNSMLDMSKIEAGRYELFKEPFVFAEALRAVEEMMSLEARAKGVVLTARCPRDIGEIVADRRALQQVLINLVGNAVKFTDKGGIVTVDARRDGETLTFSVRDTGIGIPSDKIGRLGQPFVQVSNDYTRKFEGTGLGLSLVKGLVQLHGGTLRIESVEGEGTSVTVTLPVDGAEAEAEAAEEFPPRLGTTSSAILTGEVGHGRIQAKTA
jgi:cell cycle sensor histidine kinase DivJ